MTQMKRIARYHGQDGEILEGVVTFEGDLAYVQEVSGLDDMLQGGRLLGRPRPIAEVQLAPWGVGRKILAVGKNYADHAKEMGGEAPKSPLIFMKPSSALIGPGEAIELPPESISTNVHHEAELCVVIGKRLRGAGEAECAAAIAGITCLNDVTMRDVQKSDGQWTRAKGFDTFCPVGPWVAVGLDPSNLAVRCRVNGETRQDGHTKDLIFSIPYLLAFISAGITLEPGDLFSTGTPAGVGPLKAGDIVEVEVEGVGVLRNPVRARG